MSKADRSEEFCVDLNVRRASLEILQNSAGLSGNEIT